MPITWPTTLPLPTIQGYGVQPSDAVLRTDMEAGLARQRRRFTSAPSIIAVRWIMNRSQFAIFEAWYKFQAKEGAEFFDIELLGGIGLTIHTARFTQQFNSNLFNGNLWEITSQLEIRERPTLTEGALGILLDSDYNMLIASIDALHNVVHNGTFINEV